MSARIEWTEAHRREGGLCLLRAAAEDVAAHGLNHVVVAAGEAETEAALRDTLAAWMLDDARIDRDVALVHALATASPETRAMIEAARADAARILGKLVTGRYVRETGWGFKMGPDGLRITEELSAERGPRFAGITRIYVARTRRAK